MNLLPSNNVLSSAMANGLVAEDSSVSDASQRHSAGSLPRHARP
jgi:hypothetical protein